MLRCDFHIHTLHSPDSDMKPEEVIRAALEKGLDVIGVLDHDILAGGIEAAKIAKRIAPNIIVLAGEEIKTSSGEIIALGLKETVRPKMGLKKTIKIAKKQGAFIIAPHPFDSFRKGIMNEIDDVLDLIDAIEAFNARSMLSSFTKRAIEYANLHSVPMVAGSDAHFLFEIGSGYTLVDCEKSEEAVFEAIRRKKTRICGKKTGIMPHIGTFFQKRIGKNPFTY